jgi:hypothetical protein
VDELESSQGWRYDNGKRRSTYPTLFPPDRTVPALRVPRTPSEYRGFDNWVADVRRRGGIWPPNRKGS